MWAIEMCFGLRNLFPSVHLDVDVEPSEGFEVDVREMG